MSNTFDAKGPIFGSTATFKSPTGKVYQVEKPYPGTKQRPSASNTNPNFSTISGIDHQIGGGGKQKRSDSQESYRPS